MILAAAILALARVRAADIFLTPIFWTGYLLLVDSGVRSLRGRSLLRDDRGAFAWMALLSVGLWLVFEAYNLRLQNWRYVGLPASTALRCFGYLWSFAAIWPVVLETAEFLLAAQCGRERTASRGERHWAAPVAAGLAVAPQAAWSGDQDGGDAALGEATPSGPAPASQGAGAAVGAGPATMRGMTGLEGEDENPGRSETGASTGAVDGAQARIGERSKVARRGVGSLDEGEAQAMDTVLAALGAAGLIVPLAVPPRWGAYLFGMVWVGFALLLDPLNFRAGRSSALGDLRRGERRRLAALLEAGLVCGFFWEFWNYWAVAKWVYIFPILQHVKIFEMPLAGYLGFPAFAVEVFAMYVYVSGRLGLPYHEVG